MTTHCSPAAGATTQQLVSVTADGKPAMSTPRSPELLGWTDVPAYRGRTLEPILRAALNWLSYTAGDFADVRTAPEGASRADKPAAPGSRTAPPAAPTRGAPGARGGPQAQHADRFGGGIRPRHRA